MEWTGKQQTVFLLQSIILGVMQGFALDVITGFVSSSKRKRWLWTDIAFGPLAAVVTFFGALVIMDGQLHPLLLFGVFLGMAAEHIVVGVWMGRIIRRARFLVQKSLQMGCGLFAQMAVRFVRRVKSVHLHRAKRPKKGEK